MNTLIWKTEREMQKELSERIKSYKEGCSRDGYVIRAEGKFNYRGIIYLLRVLRYYNHTNKFTTMGRNRISDCHCVVEYPKEAEPIVRVIPNDYSFEFLYHDTLHSWNDNQTIEQQIELCHKWAKEDIDNLLNGEISKQIDESIKRLQDIKDNLNKELEKLSSPSQNSSKEDKI